MVFEARKKAKSFIVRVSVLEERLLSFGTCDLTDVKKKIHNVQEKEDEMEKTPLVSNRRRYWFESLSQVSFGVGAHRGDEQKKAVFLFRLCPRYCGSFVSLFGLCVFCGLVLKNWGKNTKKILVNFWCTSRHRGRRKAAFFWEAIRIDF